MSGVADLWRPLRTPIFRQLFIADVVSDVGTFIRGVGSAWLMVSIGASPLFVALTQTQRFGVSTWLRSTIARLLDFSIRRSRHVPTDEIARARATFVVYGAY